MMFWCWMAAAHAWTTRPPNFEGPIELRPQELAVGDTDLAAELAAALEVWQSAPCLPHLPAVTVGAPIAEPVDPFVTVFDGVNSVVIDTDPDRLLDFVGAILPGLDGEVDIVLNGAYTYVDEATAGAPACTDGRSLRSALVVMLGVAYGLDESDVPGGAMYGDIEPCTTSHSQLGDDDREGLQAVWGVRPLLTCSPSIGAAPLDATCTATDLAWGDALTTSWTFEGESSSLDPFPVRIDVPRAVTVRGCASAGEACVEACQDVEVVACGPVVPAFDVLVNEDGTRQLENQTPTEPLGCVSSVRWTVYDGDAVVWRSTDWSPQVPASVVGTRVELLAEGPAGSATQDRRLGGGCGCASSDPTSAAALPLLAALLLRRRQPPQVQV